MRFALCLPVMLAAAFQEKPAAGGSDRVLLADRTELAGEITGYDASGVLEIRDGESGGTRRVVAEDVRRIRFGEDRALRPAPGGERVRLFHGGTVTGRLASFEEGIAAVETEAGTFRLRRSDIRVLSLAPLDGPLPELRDEKKDVLVRDSGKKGPEGNIEYEAVYGELLAIRGDEVVFRAEKEERYGRGSVKQVYLSLGAPAGAPLAPGWFSKIVFRNGDRLSGILRSLSGDRVGFFSHLTGAMEVEKRHVHSISFVPYARMTMESILVCDQAGVREYDFQGRELWSYAQDVRNAGSARRIENGNVLVCNTNGNEVLEVEPAAKGGGKVVWRLEDVRSPYDAVRLDNGNTLVAEQQANRVVEYDTRARKAVWVCTAQAYPTAVQRLENGHTLISSHQGLVEVDGQGRARWTLGAGRLRPWRAQRLDNGNTLIADLQHGRVAEVDPQSKEVWSKDGLRRPVQAIRLEDGNTLILEQGAGRVIEVEPSGRSVERVTGLSMPQGMSAN